MTYDAPVAGAMHARATRIGRFAGMRASVALALFAVALVPRLYRLGAQSFWYDEAQTLFVARSPYAEILQLAYRPPLYHYLLHIWSTVVPDTEFWLRLPSAVLGALIPGLVYATALRWYGRRTALLAGAMALASPALVAYAQELRMYSLLALEFAILYYLVARLLTVEERQGPGYWAALTATLGAALYTHYFALPFVLSLGALVLAILWRDRRLEALKRWIGAHALAGLAFVPWLVVIRGGRGGTEDFTQAEVSPILGEVPGVGAFMYRVWLFFTTGPTTSDWPILRGWALAALLSLALVVMGLVVCSFAMRVRRRGRPLADQRSTADLLMAGMLVLPLAVAAGMYAVRPGTVHPRHLMMLAVPLSIVLARIGGGLWDAAEQASGTLRQLARGAALVWLAMFLGLLALSTGLYHGDPALQRADVRGLADRVGQLTAAGDVVLLPYKDYAFDYYFRGPAENLYLETRVGDEDLLGWLQPRMQQAQRAVLVRWVHTLSDPRDVLDWFLQSNGHLDERFWQAERWVSVYALDRPVTLAPLDATAIEFGPLVLEAMHLPTLAAADQAIPIALAWRVPEATLTDLSASVRVMDAAGRVVAAEDRVILSEHAAAGTSHWAAGTSARNYHLLLMPAGTPPLEYGVYLTVYDESGAVLAVDQGAIVGTSVQLGTLRLERGSMPAAAPSADGGLISVGAELAPGLVLEAIAPLPGEISQAEPLTVALHWRANADLPAVQPSVELVDDAGRVWGAAAGVPVYGQYATDRWRPGELVTDYRTLRSDVEAPAGPMQVVVRVAEEAVTVGRLDLVASDREFTLPEPGILADTTLGDRVRLIGADLEPKEIQAGGPLTVILYWEMLGGDEGLPDYAVFVQLLSPDQRVIGQHDGAPAMGRWPTGSWVPGQVISDPHTVTFHDADYRGPVRIIAGLYDPLTLRRVAAGDGTDHVDLGEYDIR